MTNVGLGYQFLPATISSLESPLISAIAQPSLASRARGSISQRMGRALSIERGSSGLATEVLEHNSPADAVAITVAANAVALGNRRGLRRSFVTVGFLLGVTWRALKDQAGSIGGGDVASDQGAGAHFSELSHWAILDSPSRTNFSICSTSTALLPCSCFLNRNK